MQVNMLEAKNQLSRLVKAALAGEEIIIANHGVPAVRLVAVTPARQTGGWGSLDVAPEIVDAAFVRELDDAIAADFDNSRIFPEA